MWSGRGGAAAAEGGRRTSEDDDDGGGGKRRSLLSLSPFFLFLLPTYLPSGEGGEMCRPTQIGSRKLRPNKGGEKRWRNAQLACSSSSSSSRSPFFPPLPLLSTSSPFIYFRKSAHAFVLCLSKDFLLWRRSIVCCVTFCAGEEEEVGQEEGRGLPTSSLTDFFFFCVPRREWVEWSGELGHH